MKPIKVFQSTCGAWYLRNTGRALEARDALAALWCTERNSTDIPPSKFRRCWPFHLAMYPFYRLASQIQVERAFYAFFPVWRLWFQRQEWPACNVVDAIMGYATEPFAEAQKRGALK